jgi:hypothetical protein
MQFVTNAQMDRLRELYFPLWDKGVIKLDSLLKLLPDVGVEDRGLAAKKEIEQGNEPVQVDEQTVDSAGTDKG